ncbi:MAG: NAD(P)/FAD-dependent oxidoreductase [Tannerella sp.]|jgi:predicted Rossmann fold flavoprotein|nr:NAD(P)/FAD-dependent oxidoreductase [Tannerella sp.]
MCKKLIIIGGGAAGFFLAANMKSDDWETIILEKAKQPLLKVKVSGGGRCNLTHATFSVSELVKNYPRGEKELRSIFSRFQPADTFEWFESKGVKLKTYEDDCVFPFSNASQTIIDTLLNEAAKNNVCVHYSAEVTDIRREAENFLVFTKDKTYHADALVITTGSSLKMWKIVNHLGHSIIPPVSSLFTMNCKNSILKNLAGTTFPEVELKFPESKITQSGILLVTHRGISGPAVLKISSFGARKMQELNYRFTLKINFISTTYEETYDILTGHKSENPKKSIYSCNIKQVTNKFWNNVLQEAAITDKSWADCGKKDFNKMIDILTNTTLKITGKNPHKEEFVTAGGVDLREVDFKTMESKLIHSLYFAGEMLDIDALTGGFNLQACWSEAFVISRNFTESRRSD